MDIDDGRQLKDFTIYPMNAVYCAATRNGPTISYFYRFKFGVCKNTLEKLLPEKGLWIPVQWSYIRRWLLDASDERVILVGKLEFPLSDVTRPIQSDVCRMLIPRKKKKFVNARDPRVRRLRKLFNDQ